VAAIEFRLQRAAGPVHTVRGVHGGNMRANADGYDGDEDVTATGRPPPSLIGCALVASEAAANVARRCRSSPRLLSMLVQEKCDDTANRGRFARDFKTLADVLVQRVVAERIGRQVRPRPPPPPPLVSRSPSTRLSRRGPFGSTARLHRFSTNRVLRLDHNVYRTCSSVVKGGGGGWLRLISNIFA